MRIRRRLALYGTGVAALGHRRVRRRAVRARRERHAQRPGPRPGRSRRTERGLGGGRGSRVRARRRRCVVADLRTDDEPFIVVVDPTGAVRYSTATIDGSPPRDPGRRDARGARDGRVRRDVDAGRGRDAARGRPVRRAARRGASPSPASRRGSSPSSSPAFRAFLWIAFLVTVIVVGIVSWLVTGRALRPLVALSTTADEIAATGDLSRRLPPTPSRDEVGALTTSVNAMLDRLAASQAGLAEALEAQRRFVADASHELRTPLTTIRTSAEFLREQPDAAPEDRTEALGDVIAESERMGALVDGLLLLARSDAGLQGTPAPVDLAGLAVEAAQRYRRAGRDVRAGRAGRRRRGRGSRRARPSRREPGRERDPARRRRGRGRRPAGGGRGRAARRGPRPGLPARDARRGCSSASRGSTRRGAGPGPGSGSRSRGRSPSPTVASSRPRTARVAARSSTVRLPLASRLAGFIERSSAGHARLTVPDARPARMATPTPELAILRGAAPRPGRHVRRRRSSRRSCSAPCSGRAGWRAPRWARPPRSSCSSPRGAAARTAGDPRRSSSSRARSSWAGRSSCCSASCSPGSCRRHGLARPARPAGRGDRARPAARPRGRRAPGRRPLPGSSRRPRRPRAGSSRERPHSAPARVGRRHARPRASRASPPAAARCTRSASTTSRRCSRSRVAPLLGWGIGRLAEHDVRAARAIADGYRRLPADLALVAWLLAGAALAHVALTLVPGHGTPGLRLAFLADAAILALALRGGSCWAGGGAAAAILGLGGALLAYVAALLGGEPPDQAALAVQGLELLALALVVAPRRGSRSRGALGSGDGRSASPCCSRSGAWVGAFRAATPPDAGEAPAPAAMATGHDARARARRRARVMPAVEDREPTAEETAAVLALPRPAHGQPRPLRGPVRRPARPATRSPTTPAASTSTPATPTSSTTAASSTRIVPSTSSTAEGPDGLVLLGAMFSMPSMDAPGPPSAAR